MPKKPPPLSLLRELESGILHALHQLPFLTPGQRNAVKSCILPVVLDALNTPTSGGRPRSHDTTERELCQRISALTHPRVKYLEKNQDTGATKSVEAEGELRQRYQARGVWPDTKTKWAADTDAYLRGWWDRANWDAVNALKERGDPPLKYPADAIAERLGPTSRKGAGSLMALAFFVVAARYGIKPETVRAMWNNYRKSAV